MNPPDAENKRASLEVARAALGRMTGAPSAPGARAIPMTIAARAGAAWTGTQAFLQVVTGHTGLSGQALLTDARRAETLDMEDMHALVALHEWTARTVAPGSAAAMLTLPPTDAERDVAANAIAALERVATRATGSVASNVPVQPDTSSRSPWAPQPAADGGSAMKGGTPPPRSAGTPAAPDRVAAPAFPAQPAAYPSDDSSSAVPTSKRSLSSGAIMAALVLVLLVVGAIVVSYVRNRGGPNSQSLTEQGVAAYSRGSKETARLAFANALAENPDDVRALIYLGRIAREQGSMETSRQYLERAIRADPNNALASRELASALLADKQYELARRFYVRALTLDPNDRTAQGFLGCALVQLDRSEEANRWFDRAGAGEWSNCARTPAGSPAKD